MEKAEDKMAADLAQLLTSDNPDTPVDVIASLKPGVSWSHAQRAIQRADPQARIKAFHRLIHAVSLRTTVGELRRLAGLPAVRRLWTDVRAQLDLQPPPRDSPSPPEDYTTPQEVVSAQDLLDMGLNGSRVVVAILDTGIDTTHPDLDDFDDNDTTTDPKVLGQVSFAEGDPFPFDLNGHGTYCAGLVAGTGAASNGTYRGIAPGAALLSVKVLLPNGTGYSSWVIRGIEWSITHGADIILLPFSTFGMPGDPLSESIHSATEQGVLVVAAAGDRGPNHMTVMSPGEAASALTVGAYDHSTGRVAEFSGRGPTFDMRSKPDLVAPGVGLISCSLYDIVPSQVGNFSLPFSPDEVGFVDDSFGQPVDENYTMASTTAAAASVAAGVACLLLQGCRYATPQCLDIAMRQGATPLTGEPNVEGHGLLNASAAYWELEELHNMIPPTFRPRSVTPGLPYYGVVMSSTPSGERNTTLMVSTYATEMAAVVTSSSTNMTMIHMLMGMFFLSVEGGSPTPFAFLDAEEEMHWTTLPNDNYVRATGILSYGDLLIIPRIETWSISTGPPANAFRITIILVNIGEEDLQGVKLYSLWHPDLFYDANDTSTEVASFNPTSSLFQVYADCLPPNESTRIDQYVGFNSSTPPDSYEVGRYGEVYQHLMNKTLNGSTHYTGDVGMAAWWDLGDLQADGGPTNVTLTLGFGDNQTALLHGINTTWQKENPFPLADLCIIRLLLPRTGQPDAPYHTEALILNIGDEEVKAVAGFLTNRTQPMGGAVFTRYFQLGVMEPFSWISLELDWNPEVEDIYFASWYVGPEMELNWTSMTWAQDHYMLDNMVFRDVFISVPPPMRLVSPQSLPIGPMTLRFPGDYAIYNLSLLTSTPISSLQISVAGSGSEWINVTPVEIEGVKVDAAFQVTVMLPTFPVAGLYEADLLLLASDGWQGGVHLEVNLTYPKGRILFDTAHNSGLNITGMEEDLAGLDLEELMEVFREMADSVFTGYSRLRELFAQAQLSLMEVPMLEEINATLLDFFDGIVICDPERGFTDQELANLTSYMEEGFSVIILADNPQSTNHTSLNLLLAGQGLQLGGSVHTANTSDLAPSPFTLGVDSITTANGTYLQVNGSVAAEVFAWANGTPVGTYIYGGGRELLVFGSSAAFDNTHLIQPGNLAFANNTISHLFVRHTLELTVQPMGGNGSIFTLGEHAGFVVDALNRTGQGVEGLEIYCLFLLANGSEAFFKVFEVKMGRYGTFLLSDWAEMAGNYTIIIFVIPGNYCSTMAYLHFTYVEPPSVPEQLPEPDYYAIMLMEILIACVLAGLSVSIYAVRQHRKRIRMRTPVLDEQLIMRIDNALNTTHALIRELEWTLTDRRLDRVDKLYLSAGEMGQRLERALQKLRELSRETGA